MVTTPNINEFNGQFSIGFFELMFLAESVIPDRPIARSVCFDSFSEVHYHNMREEQKKQFFEYVSRLDGFDLNNKQCLHFHNRFNPDNQYIVTYFYDEKVSTVNCYLHDEKYHIQINRFVNQNHIIKIVKKSDLTVVYSKED